MDPQQQFCLKWNSFGSNLVNTFDHLFKSASLTDVTLFCEGVTFQAHKLILAACSKHFQDLFESAPMCPSILVILDGTSSSNMSALLEFMYKGEVHVAQESLSSFLKAAEYLQVKGLSVEQEKLVTQPHSSGSDGRLDSPGGSGRCPTKLGKGGGYGGGGGGGGKCEEGAEMLPPSSTASPYTSPYHQYKPQMYEPHITVGSAGHPAYDVPLRAPSKRPRSSPSNQRGGSGEREAALVRASVLRDGSKPERESPLGYGQQQQQQQQQHHFDSLPPSIPALQDASGGPFERTMDKSPSPQMWHATCGEDLRTVKCEENSSGNVDEGGGMGDARKYFTSGSDMSGVTSMDIMGTSSPSTSSGPGPGGWNSLPIPASKMDTAHKGVTTTTTPDGKKLQCPFCERLYGYETNLRAHIRQRHQGIRVPCPFCSRTFTRNNTVRRHIAREHKNELSLKAMHVPSPSSQGVQNHQ